MSYNCFSCQDTDITEDIVKCSQCDNCFHFQCVGMTEINLKKMSQERKCNECRQKPKDPDAKNLEASIFAKLEIPDRETEGIPASLLPRILWLFRIPQLSGRLATQAFFFWRRRRRPDLWIKESERVARFNQWNSIMCLANVFFFLDGTDRQRYEKAELELVI